MKKSDVKELNRRDLLLGTVALGLTSGCSAANTVRKQATETIKRPARPRWPEFMHLDPLVEEYRSPIEGIADGTLNARHLLSKCLESVPTDHLKKVTFDFSAIPNGKLKSMQDFEPELSSNPNVKDLVLHPAPPANDTGVVCIWYGQMHAARHFATNKLIQISPRAVNSQLRIILSAQNLAHMGVRLFGMEGDTISYPAMPAESDSSQEIYRISEDLEYETNEIKKGKDAFRVLQSRYPFIDVHGVDGSRRKNASLRLGATTLRKRLIASLGDLGATKRLLDEDRVDAYVEYLESHREKGHEVLRGIRLAAAAQICLTTYALDREGVNYVDPAIHNQLTHMKRVLGNPSFLKAQQGREFVPNVFALQYGLAHKGIPEACKKFGISCIEVNASILEASTVNEINQETEQELKDNQKILEKLGY